MTPVIVLGLSWLALIWGLDRARWRATDPLGLALIISGVLLVVRPTLIVAGFDDPFPDLLFEFKNVDAVVIRTQIPVIVWLLVLPPVARLAAGRRTRPPRVLAPPTDRQVVAALVPLMVLAVMATAVAWAQYGGPAGLTAAAKNRELPGSIRLLRTLPVAVAFLGAAAAVFTPAGPRRKAAIVTGSLAWLLGAGLAFSFGARDAAVAPLLLPFVRLFGTPRRLNAEALRRTVRRVPRVALGITLVLLVAVGLRAWRDTTLTGRIQSTIADQTLVRQMSVATNLTQYDAMMIVTLYGGRGLERGGVDLVVDSFLAPVPALGQPVEPPAITVARFTNPLRRNGYPLSAAGDWYFALGVLGVAIGAVVSGIVLGRLESWRRRVRDDSQVAAMAFLGLWGTTIALGGVSLTTPARAWAIGGPFVLVLFLVRELLPRRQAATTRRPAYGQRFDALDTASAWAARPVVVPDGPPPALVDDTASAVPQPTATLGTTTTTAPRTSMRADLMTTLSANVGGVLLGLLVAFVGPRILSQYQFGLLGWSMSAAYVLGALAALGLPLRLVAELPRLPEEEQRRFIGHSIHVTVLAAIPIGAALGLAGAWMPGLIGEGFAPIAALAGALVVPSAVLAVESAAFRARGRFRAASATNEQITRAAWLIGLLAAAATTATARVSVGVAIGVLVVLASLAYVQLGVTGADPLPDRPAAFLHATVPFLAGSLGAALLPQAGALTLGAATTGAEVGVFTAALRLVMLCSIVAAAGLRVIAPRISAHRGSGEDLTRLVRPVASLTFWATAVTAAPIVVGGPWLTRLLFGPEYGSAWAPAAAMLIGVLVNAYTGPAGQILYSRGQQRRIGSVTLLGGLVYLPLSFVAAHVADSLGVALVSSAIIATMAIWQARLAERVTGARSWSSPNPVDVLTAVRDSRQTKS